MQPAGLIEVTLRSGLVMLFEWSRPCVCCIRSRPPPPPPRTPKSASPHMFGRSSPLEFLQRIAREVDMDIMVFALDAGVDIGESPSATAPPPAGWARLPDASPLPQFAASAEAAKGKEGVTPKFAEPNAVGRLRGPPLVEVSRQVCATSSAEVDQTWSNFGETWPDLGQLSTVPLHAKFGRIQPALDRCSPNLADLGQICMELDQL